MITERREATEPPRQHDVAGLEPTALRSLIAEGAWARPTLGLAAGYVQANLTVLPAVDAFNFLLFCLRNPKACPVIEVGERGRPTVDVGGVDADLRYALPRYRVFTRGRVVAEPADLGDHWRDDAVAFVLGCSLTFEGALLEAGVPLRHIESGTVAPMYVTDVSCVPAGRFRGPLVVSMRPIPARDVARTVRITARHPWGHGAPVHVGEPGALGIEDLGQPSFGDPPHMEAGDVPVFWACGVTPQEVITRAAPEYAFTHYPGHMLVTDHRAALRAEP